MIIPINQQEAEALQAYTTYFDSYISGDADFIAGLLDENYTQIGSAEAEVFFNKSDALHFLKDTIDQVAGKSSIRNRVIKTGTLAEYVLVIDLFDLYVLTGDDWVFYSRFRASTLMEKISGEWKFIHQHSSFPDIRTNSGENIAIEKIAEENIALKDAIKRRTIELEQKHRELEIETALERVRTVAMSMHHPEDMLDVCAIISKELQSLGIANIRNIQTAIFYPDDGIYLNYVYFSLIDHKVVTRVEYKIQPDLNAFVQKMQDDPQAFFTTSLEGEKLKDWIAYQQQSHHFVDPALFEVDSVFYYFFSIGRGALGISAYAPLNDLDISLFKRFRNVFELAYRRFMDIELAMAQAKESQIQLALERVRARTMAMQKSEELSEAVFELFQQFKFLGENPDQATIGIINEKEKVIEYWVTMYGSQLNKVFKFSIDEPNVTNKIYHAWKENKKSLVIDLTGESLSEFMAYRAAMGGAAINPDEKRRIINVAFFSKGLLNVQSVKDRSVENVMLLERFAAVFEQTYTRFLDLEKAEAQAREAQVEAALEKVRSRSLAMHHSDELKDIIILAFEKLRELEVHMDSACILTFHKKEKGHTVWAANPDLFSVTSTHVPYFNDPIHKAIYDTREHGNGFIDSTWTFEEKNRMYENLFEHTDWKYFPDDLKKTILEFDGWGFTGPIHKNSATLLVSYSQKKFSAYEKKIIKQLGNVFEQAYIRFLDLQKAEAQAREAQIQLALERIRARTMAMHRSEEIVEVMGEVFKKLKELDVKVDSANLFVFTRGATEVEVWTANAGGSYSIRFMVPISSGSQFPSIIAKMESGEEFFSKSYNFEEKNNFFNTLFTNTDYKLIPEERKKFILESPRYTIAVGISKNIAIQLNNYSELNFSEEENNLIIRFTRVFEQSYTRFLDLQKAEAQAREAQIQLALERVRARTMAMHRSEEIVVVMGEVISKLKELGVKVFSANLFVFTKGALEVEVWTANPGGSNSTRFMLPISTGPQFPFIIDKMEKKEDLYTHSYTYEEKNEFFRNLFTNTNYKFVTEERKKFILESPGYNISVGISKNIALQLNNYSATGFTREENEINVRFTKVFEQSYTRFLDLQKAEAQAREAQIEASLERVRSKAMGMHKSKDVTSATNTMFDELKKLGINYLQCGVANIHHNRTFAVFAGTSLPNGNMMNGLGIFGMDEHPVWQRWFESWVNKDAVFIANLSGEEKKHYFNNIQNHRNNSPGQISHFPDNFFQAYYFEQGALWTYSLQQHSKPEKEVMERFARAFSFTFRRYQDLKKSEAEAREAQIEAALERVRSKAMAMTISSALNEVIECLYSELKKLDPQMDRCFIITIDPVTKDSTWWMAPGDGLAFRTGLILQKNNHPPFVSFLQAWEQRTEKWVYTLEGKVKKEWDSFIFKETGLSQVTGMVKQNMLGIPKVNWAGSFQQFGCMSSVSKQPLAKDAFDLLVRFSNVFDLTYTRFLDLQKAEAQAREAQIEASLERVRSRTMGMQKSEELKEVIQVVFEQFIYLSINIEHTGFVIDYKVRDDYRIWIADKLGSPSQVTIPHFDALYYDRFIEAKNKGEDFFAVNLSFEEKNNFYFDLFRYIPELPGDSKQYILNTPALTISTVLLDNVSLYIENFTGIPFSDEENAILMRFGKVFQQTYTRFLDLQKAEGLARESRIEVALEKVRSRTMGMLKSEDLQDAVVVLFQQLKELGENPERIFIGVFDEYDENYVDLWGTYQGGQKLAKLFRAPVSEPTVISKIARAWNERKNSAVIDLSGEELAKYLSFLSEIGIPVVKGVMSERRVQTVACFSKGVIGLTTPEPVPVESINLLERIAAVFDLTYTRFLDLQKAEAQAREAQIEAALERVRSKTMAMHNSNDVTSATETMFEEFKKLGIENLRCGIANIHPTKTFDVFGVTYLTGGNKMSGFGYFGMDEHPVWQRWFDSWKKKEEVFIAYIAGQEKEEYFKIINTHPDYLPRKIVDFPDSYFQAYYFEQGSVWTYSLNQHSTSEKEILQRFARGFSLTFRRYQDLKKAEAQGMEAIKRASVDRVRAEIASMRTTSDLERIQPLIWNELTTLGVPFMRCGVFIMDEEKQEVQTHLSTPDGKGIAAFRLPYLATEQTTQIVKHWQQKKIYKDHMDEAAFVQYTKNLVMHGAIESSAKYITENRPTDLYLHFLPFLQGMLYAGNSAPLNDDELNLVQNLADAFSTAYARYEDFNKLITAKQQVDKALNDLKQAQQQLVQSEKMASLGELTAGIAHEIQNPLNFVNNFSEVSNEMIGEMKDELATGNIHVVSEIADSLQQNLEKILHHGKRADAIVKGMLQHSRTSSGRKEPVDINALADEYLRLSYHGLRAKDKSFNATIKTSFENKIDKVQIIPQDIGRVLLNLYNNAFYAISEKAKLGIHGYEPTVIVGTQKENGKIFISVSDNGNGIPKKIVEKIFQPFFTTKPTGVGTGLGLSLSYDIITKGHGGELKVETREGEGSLFIIHLPV